MDYLNPKLPPYNAVGDLSAYDTPALDACFAAALLSGAPVYVPPGQYLVTHLAPIAQSIVISGASSGRTSIVTDQPTGDVMAFQGSGADVSRIGFGVLPGVIRTADAFVFFDVGALDSRLSLFFMRGHFVGVRVTSRSTVRISDGTMLGGRPGAGGSGIVVAGGNDHYLQTVTMNYDAAIGMPESGVRVEDVGCLNLTNVQLIHMGTCLKIIGGSSIRGVNCYFDSSIKGVLIQPQLRSIARVVLTGCWACGHSGNGAVIAGAGGGTVGGIDLVGLEAMSNGANGLAVTPGVAGVNVNGGLFAGNGGAGINIAGGVCRVGVTGAVCGDVTGQLPGNGTYGIRVDPGPGDALRFVGNDLRGNGIAGLSDLSTGLNKAVGPNLV